MIASSETQMLSPKDLIASLRCTVQRLEQSENPAAVVFLKEILIERIAELEKQTEETPVVRS